MKFSLILVLLLGACATCLKPRDFNKLIIDKEYKNEDLSFLNGKYRCIKYNFFGEETQTECLTIFENGVIKHHSGKVILMKEATLILNTKETKVYEFIHDNINYQLFVEAESIELVSINSWDIFRRIKNEK